MPSINVAMERSLRRSVSDVVFASLFGKRQTIPDRVESVKNTFSSWDACMEKTYCKWPVIAGIIIGGLILFSIVSCIVRCCCCGMSCCCSCFSFLKCCDCCGGSCDGKKNKPMKHLDDPYAHHNMGPSAGYQAPASMPMMGGGLAAAKPAPPQYAQFEVGPSGLAVAPKPQPALSEDALPPMPSWDGASKKHVETEEEKDAVELKNLDPATGQKVPLMAGGAAPGSSIPPSPNFDRNVSPYGARPGQGGNNGYVGAGGVDQYGQSQNSLNNVGYAAPMNGSNRGYASPPPQDTYGQNTNFVGAAAGGYNQRRPQRQNTGDRQYQNTGNQYQNTSNQYQNTGGQYQNTGNQYQNTGDQYQDTGDQYQSSGNQYQNNSIDRKYPQASSQYSGNSSARQMTEYSDLPEVYDNSQAPSGGPSRGPGPNRMASPSNNNNQGFDFGNNANQSYSRPGMQQSQQQPSYNSGRSQARGGGNDGYYNNGSSTPAPSYASRSPPPQDAGAYNNYSSPSQSHSQPYPNNNNRGPPSSRPGQGARRDPRSQPQGWDPVNNH